MSKATSKTQAVPTFTIGEGVSLTEKEQASITAVLSYVRSGDYSADRVEALAREAAAFGGREKKAAAMRRVFGASAIYAATQSGVIGSGDGQVSQNKWADAHGMSKSDASGLVSLGKAISVGFGPEFPQYGKASARCTTAKIGEALRKGTDGAHVDRLVQAALTVTPKPRQGKADETPADVPEGEVTPVNPFEAAKEAAKVLDGLSKGLTDEEFAVVARTVTRMLTREGTVRSAKAKKTA